MSVLATEPVAAARPPGAARRGGHPAIALAVILTCQLMVILDGTVVNVALPKIQSGLHFSATGLSWVINAYTLTLGGLLLLGGRAGDILGRRRVFSAGIALFTVASLAGGLATSAGMLLAARAVQGVGAAIATPSTLALLMITFPAGPARNRALGLFSAVSAAGGSVGLLLGGALTDWISWRWVLFVNVPIGAAILLAVPLFVTEPPRNPGRFDVAGALASTAGMGSLVYGFIRAAERGWGDPVTLASFGVAAVLLAAFVAHESRVAQPVLPLRLFADRARAAGYLTMLLLPAVLFGAFFFTVQYMQLGLGFSPLMAGAGFLPLTVMIFSCSRLVPRGVSRYGPGPFLLAGPVMLLLAALWLSRLSAGTGYAAGLLGPITLLGLGGGLTFMPLTSVILARVPAADSGAASGLLQAMMQLGGTVGLAVLVTVFGAATGHTGGALGLAALTHGIDTVFAAGAVFAACAWLVVAVGMRPTRALSA
jgi:EmrB/QacA subfamily drug resistance transporter